MARGNSAPGAKWSLIKELCSVLKNAAKLGAPVPDKLTRFLKMGLNAINSTKDQKEDTESDNQDGG